MQRKSFILKSAGVSFAIVICRILGLVREALLAWRFGGGTLMSAWGLAFMLPNLFRRLFGEGALGASMIPIFSHSFEKESRLESRRKLGAVFISLSLLLSVITIVFSVLALMIEPLVEVERVRLMLEMIPIVMPYAVFICLVGAMSSALNSAGMFFLPAVGSLSLNIFMIICLLWICPLFKVREDMLKMLGVFVVISGCAQLIFTLFLMKFAGIMPVLRNSQFWREPVLRELWQLTLPGIIGASALQISFVVDRSMACWLGDYAVPALNYTDRIIDLPIGIFAVAMATVVAPTLARSVARGDEAHHKDLFLSSLNAMLFLSIPIATFIYCFRTPIVRIFYMRGAFGERELVETVLAMTFYSLGIPFFCVSKIIISSFHSRKDMKTPVKVSFACIILNVVLNLAFMFKLKQGGIALATVISSFCNCAILLYILKKRNEELKYFSTLSETVKIFISALGSAIFANQLWFFLARVSFISMPNYVPVEIIPLTICLTIFVFTFLIFTVLLRAESSDVVLKSAKFAFEKIRASN